MHPRPPPCRGLFAGPRVTPAARRSFHGLSALLASDACAAARSRSSSGLRRLAAVHSPVRSRCDCSVAICFVTPSFRISLRSVPPGLLRRGSGVLGPLPKLDPLRASSTMSIGGVLSGGFSSEYPATPGSPPSSPRISFPRALAICCRHHSVGSDSGAAVHLPSYKDKELDNVTEL